jgi:hypothetical protein
MRENAIDAKKNDTESTIERACQTKECICRMKEQHIM